MKHKDNSKYYLFKIRSKKKKKLLNYWFCTIYETIQNKNVLNQLSITNYLSQNK